MFFLKKKKEEERVDLSWLRTDMHSHLIPAVDDGSQNIETSIRMIKGLVALGYKKIVTTPHVLWEIYPNTTEIINHGLGELKAAVAAQGLDVELHAAAEYFIDDHFEEQLKNKVPLLTISENKVLVEFSMVTTPLDLQQAIFEMQMQDYQPVIAHPERYTYLIRKKEIYDELKNAGCMFQLNLLSLTGYYGETVQELAEYLVKKNYYNFAGTDAHHERHVLALHKLASVPFFQRLKGLGVLKNNLL